MMSNNTKKQIKNKGGTQRTKDGNYTKKSQKITKI